jgi:hypothetical protein
MVSDSLVTDDEGNEMRKKRVEVRSSYTESADAVTIKLGFEDGVYPHYSQTELVISEHHITPEEIADGVTFIDQLIDGLLREKDNLINTYCQEEIEKEIA